MRLILMRNTYLAGLVLAIFGIVMLFQASEKRAAVDEAEALDINTVLIGDIAEGIVLEGDLHFNGGAFVEEYTTKNGARYSDSKYTYLIIVGEEGCIGVQVKGDDFFGKMERQTDETIAYLSGETSVMPQAVYIRGPVKRMDSESYQYMKEYLSSMGYSNDEVNTYAYPYYIDTCYYTDWQFLFWGGILCIVVGVGTILIKLLIENFKIKKRRAEREQEFTVPPVAPASAFTPYQPSTLKETENEYEDTDSDGIRWQVSGDSTTEDQEEDDTEEISSSPFRLNSEEL